MIDNSLTPYFDNWSSYKLLTIQIFTDDTQTTRLYQYTNSTIKENSFVLVDSICDDENINFIGCLAKNMRVTVYQTGAPDDFDLTDYYVTVHLEVADSQDVFHRIALFSGYIDSCKLKNTGGFYEIEAFDDLYGFIDTDVFEWYETLPSKFTIKQFRDSLFTYLGLTQVTTTLVNDSIEVNKAFGKFVLPAIDCIKSVCQVNGVFGRVKHTPNQTTSSKTDTVFDYLSVTTNNQQTINVDGRINKISIDSFTTKRINTVNVYGTLSNVEYQYGNPGTATNKTTGEQANTYTIQGGILLKNLNSLEPTERTILNTLATNLLSQVTQFPPYIPFESENIGYPNAECGDGVRFKYMKDDGSEVTVTSTILYRKLSDIQAIKDRYRTYGQRYITSITSSIAVQNAATVGTIDETDNWIQSVEDGTNESFNNKVDEIAQQTTSRVLSTVSDTIIESLSTNITGTALIPKIVHSTSDDGWEWVEGQSEGQPIRTFSRTNTRNYRSYINIENDEAKHIFQGLTPPADSSDIQDSETELLRFNGKQIYYKDISNFNSGFTLVSPKTINPQLSSYVEDMYKCRKLKNSNISEWMWNTFADVTTTSVEGTTYINFNAGIELLTDAVISCVSNTVSHYLQTILKNTNSQANGIRIYEDKSTLLTNDFESEMHPVILVTDLDDVPANAPELSIVGLYTDTSN